MIKKEDLAKYIHDESKNKDMYNKYAAQALAEYIQQYEKEEYSVSEIENVMSSTKIVNLGFLLRKNFIDDEGCFTDKGHLYVIIPITSLSGHIEYLLVDM